MTDSKKELYICDHAQGWGPLEEDETCFHKVPHEWMGDPEKPYWMHEDGKWCSPYPIQCKQIVFECECMRVDPSHEK